jgi:hypothetical protein
MCGTLLFDSFPLAVASFELALSQVNRRMVSIRLLADDRFAVFGLADHNSRVLSWYSTVRVGNRNKDHITGFHFAMCGKTMTTRDTMTLNEKERPVGV